MIKHVLLLSLAFTLILVFSSGAQAQTKRDETVVNQTTTEETTETVEGAVGQAGDRRQDSRFDVLVEYSPLDLILPSKIGGSLGYVESSAYTFELEYLGASISPPAFLENVGGFTDRRISLVVRSYGDRNSFNFHYGLSYFDMQIHVGSKYLQSSSGRPADVDLLASRSLGFVVGVGNRWVLPHGFTVGVDWISWSQPLIIVEKNSDLLKYIQDQHDRDVLESLISTIGYFPRFTVLKVGLGLTF